MTPAATKAPIFIGGEWVETDSEYDVHLPYDGSLIARVSWAGAEEVTAACRAARNAGPVMGVPSMFDSSKVKVLFTT